jgi:hypothetical protein
LVRSPISLGIVFLAMAGLAVAGVPGARLGPGAWAVVGLLGAAGLLVMTRVRAAYYLGVLAGVVTATSGVIAWALPSLGGRFALPMHPAFSIVVGLYLCLRVAMAHRMFGAPREP